MTDWTREEVGRGVLRAPIVRLVTVVDTGPGDASPPRAAMRTPELLYLEAFRAEFEAEVRALRQAQKGLRIELTALRKHAMRGRF